MKYGLTKALITKRDEIAARLKTAEETLRSALEEANDFRQMVVDAANEYYNERSEKWLESDAGSAYSDWMDDWDQEIFEDENLEASETLLSLPEKP